MIPSLSDPVVPCTLRQLARAAFELGRDGGDFQAWWSRIVASQLRSVEPAPEPLDRSAP